MLLIVRLEGDIWGGEVVMDGEIPCSIAITFLWSSE